MNLATLDGRFELSKEIAKLKAKGENPEELCEKLHEANCIYGDPTIYVYNFGDENVALYTIDFIHLYSDAWSEFEKDNGGRRLCYCSVNRTFLNGGICIKGDAIEPYRKPLTKWRVYEDMNNNLWFEKM